MGTPNYARVFAGTDRRDRPWFLDPNTGRITINYRLEDEIHALERGWGKPHYPRLATYRNMNRWWIDGLDSFIVVWVVMYLRPAFPLWLDPAHPEVPGSGFGAQLVRLWSPKRGPVQPTPTGAAQRTRRLVGGTDTGPHHNITMQDLIRIIEAVTPPRQS